MPRLKMPRLVMGTRISVASEPSLSTYSYINDTMDEFNPTFEVQNMGNKAFQNASFGNASFGKGNEDNSCL